MPKTFKPGYTYGYSNELKMEWAINDATGVITTADGVHYSPQEQLLLYQKYGCIPEKVHIVKKVFKGVLVNAEDYPEPKEEDIRQAVGQYKLRTENQTDSGRSETSRTPSENNGKRVSESNGILPPTQPGLF
ncbi:MAG: hypothetical protein KBT02_11845 [Treponema sp.]|nr:hypothetical protein [Candidatus Treponema caballi]